MYHNGQSSRRKCHWHKDKGENMKSCFVITPVGKKNSKIYSEITAVIDESITPALQGKFKITAAHLMLKPGAINKQIVDNLCNADLSIANLTNKNPNVMYELAIRHMLGKPVIIIANKRTKLPFDTLSYRTIFYDYSEDGLSALKKQISTAVTEIDFTEITSPVIDLMPLNCKEKRVFSENIEKNRLIEDIDGLFKQYILEKQTQENGNRKIVRIQLFQLSYSSSSHNLEERTLKDNVKSALKNMPEIEIIEIRAFNNLRRVFILCVMDDGTNAGQISSTLLDLFEKDSYKNVSVFSSTCTGLSDAITLIDSVAEQNKNVKQASSNS